MNPLDQLPRYRVFTNPQTEEEIITNNGIEKCLSQDYEEGIADFNHALRLDPNNQGATFNKGMALIRWGYARVLDGHDNINTGMNELAKLPDMRRKSLGEWADSFQDYFRNLRYLD